MQSIIMTVFMTFLKFMTCSWLAIKAMFPKSLIFKKVVLINNFPICSGEASRKILKLDKLNLY